MPAFDTSRSIGPKRSSVGAHGRDDVGLAGDVGGRAPIARSPSSVGQRRAAACAVEVDDGQAARALGGEALGTAPGRCRWRRR